MRILLIFGILLLFADCTSANRESQQNKINLADIGYFVSYSDEMIGCGCSFYLDQTLKEEGKFFYSDVGDKAFIRYKDKTLTLNILSYDSINHTSIFSNKEYEITYRIINSNQLNTESTSVQGELIFKNLNTGGQLKINFIGDCGC